jgi:magnesium chelatase subunit D
LAGETEPGRRSEIIRRRLEFERDSAAFRARWAASTAALKAAVERARGLLPRLRLTDQARGRAAALAAEARAAGHRADLALCLAARAAAAFAQAQAAESADDAGGGELCEVQPDWVDRMAAHVVPARRRPPPRPASRPIEAVVVRQAAEADRLAEAFSLSGQPEKPPEPRDESPDPDQALTLTIYETAESFEIVSPKTRAEIGSRLRAGRRGSRETAKARGRAFKTTARRLGRPLSLSATLRAAAPRQAERRLGEEERLILKPADLREKVYRQKTGRLVVFVVDSSGSIGTLYRMEEAKAAALALLADAYRKRDRVALVAFYGREAQLLLPPTNSPDLAARLLAALPSGGKTPLAAALALTHQLLRTERARDPKLTPYVVLMTDGRPNVPLEPQAAPWPEVLRLAGLMAADPSLKFLLIDTDRGAYNEYKLTRELAERLGCPRINLEELREGRLERWLETA